MISIDQICGEKENCRNRALEHTLELAVEIAREGREGRRIGTIFVVADEAEVLRRSRPLILDPLAGHPKEARRICDPNLRETIKELAQLDGAFVVGGDGVVRSAARHLNASADGVELPLGLGSRHMAGASITRDTDSVAVVVSQSAMVRVFNHGALVAEILPEMWMFSRRSIKIQGPHRESTVADLRIVAREAGVPRAGEE
jgi:diadenylate cyclase